MKKEKYPPFEIKKYSEQFNLLYFAVHCNILYNIVIFCIQWLASGLREGRPGYTADLGSRRSFGRWAEGRGAEGSQSLGITWQCGVCISHHVITMSSSCHHHHVTTMLTLNRRQMGYNLVRNVPRRDALDDSVFCDASMCTMNPSLSVCVWLFNQNPNNAAECQNATDTEYSTIRNFFYMLYYINVYNI